MRNSRRFVNSLLFALAYLPALAAGSLLDARADDQPITISVAPFAGVGEKTAKIGTRTGAILNLQIWQTLRIPPNADGNHARGTVTWDFDSRPPTTFVEAETYAAAQKDQEPQVVVWGRAWQYGSGTIAEAFLSIREGKPEGLFGADLWTVNTPDGDTFAVGVPRRQIEFKPIVIRSDLLPELVAPDGLTLYRLPSGPESLGPVGNYFTALEQGADSTKVRLPNGTEGWIHLPSLSRERSEVVDFSGGILRIFRRDWAGARQLLLRAAQNAHAPTAVRSDSYLYIAVAAARSGGDPVPWIKKAYELDPYSKIALQYLCMSQLQEAYSQAGDNSGVHMENLNRLLKLGAPLYSRNDPWFLHLNTFVDHYRSKAK